MMIGQDVCMCLVCACSCASLLNRLGFVRENIQYGHDCCFFVKRITCFV